MANTRLLEGGTCQDLEDDFDEQSEEFDNASDDASLNNPEELDIGDDVEIPDDPNVDVNVDADVEADIETEVNVDVNVDVTLEMFLEEDLERTEPGIDFVTGAEGLDGDERP